MARQLDIYDCIREAEERWPEEPLESDEERKAREFKAKLDAWRRTSVPIIVPAGFGR